MCVCAKNGGVDIAYADSQRLTRCQGVAASSVSSFVWGNKFADYCTVSHINIHIPCTHVFTLYKYFKL